MQTLFFPLKTIGDSNNSFIGVIKNLKVFNQILTETQIKAINTNDIVHKNVSRQFPVITLRGSGSLNKRNQNGIKPSS